jgi:hypothetical protein
MFLRDQPQLLKDITRKTPEYPLIQERAIEKQEKDFFLKKIHQLLKKQNTLEETITQLEEVSEDAMAQNSALQLDLYKSRERERRLERIIYVIGAYLAQT